MATKNITVKVDAEVYRKARIRAAEQGTSVSAMVREFLRSIEGRSAEIEVDSAQQKRSLLERLWARTDELPRLAEPATIGSRDALYKDAMRERGVR